MAKIAKDTAPMSTQRSEGVRANVQGASQKGQEGMGYPESPESLNAAETILQGCLFVASLCNTCCVLYIQF